MSWGSHGGLKSGLGVRNIPHVWRVDLWLLVDHPLSRGLGLFRLRLKCGLCLLDPVDVVLLALLLFPTFHYFKFIII